MERDFKEIIQSHFGDLVKNIELSSLLWAELIQGKVVTLSNKETITSKVGTNRSIGVVLAASFHITLGNMFGNKMCILYVFWYWVYNVIKMLH